jgi:predicted RNA-binding Zn-ribbon protein involved in translation (DUF1610 family)
MSNTLQTSTLKCTSCGSSLNVSSDMERFACGYCGTDQVVLRSGGTVSLKPVEDAIHKVQVGTDKTAAELALVRLPKELAELEASWRQCEEQLAVRRGSLARGRSALNTTLVILMVISGLVGVLALGVRPRLGLISMGVAAVCWLLIIYNGWLASKKVNSVDAERMAAWQPFAQRIEAIKQQIAKNRQILDA